MSARHPFPHSLLPSGRKAGFMALLLLVSLLAHLFIIDWARDSLAIVSLLDDDEDVIQVTLHTALSPPPPKAASPKPLPSSPAPDQTSAPLPAPETALATGPANPPVAASDNRQRLRQQLRPRPPSLTNPRFFRSSVCRPPRIWPMTRSRSKATARWKARVW